mgnify:CR=1 FL=1
MRYIRNLDALGHRARYVDGFHGARLVHDETDCGVAEMLPITWPEFAGSIRSDAEWNRRPVPPPGLHRLGQYSSVRSTRASPACRCKARRLTWRAGGILARGTGGDPGHYHLG